MDFTRLDSTVGSSFVSPLDNFLHYVPKEQETAVRQALYNAAALALLALLGVGAFYSCVVLEPFLLPLFWAVLTGFVLFFQAISIDSLAPLEGAFTNALPVTLLP